MLVWLDKKEFLIRPVLNCRDCGNGQVTFDWPTQKGLGIRGLVDATSVMDHTVAIAEIEKMMDQQSKMGNETDD